MLNKPLEELSHEEIEGIKEILKNSRPEVKIIPFGGKEIWWDKEVDESNIPQILNDSERTRIRREDVAVLIVTLRDEDKVTVKIATCDYLQEAKEDFKKVSTSGPFQDVFKEYSFEQYIVGAEIHAHTRENLLNEFTGEYRAMLPSKFRNADIEINDIVKQGEASDEMALTSIDATIDFEKGGGPMPSIAEFFEEISPNIPVRPKVDTPVHPKAKCPCGSGIRYKYCCGKK